ncbi:ADP-ribosyl cyclase/cyclic ADP-ribose hydrolase 1-like [Pangasianodon hypophthalmus]|uniref:ADP-ribosyl cyclase/cyclic ADP-ribose hydrolase 1-like n=1 Tax=Pangasianodon hypophthalmus TaxID=310915 RepID=UPI002307691B|nr:ADP-ribosyl cyclase/cyclic ADP-ribose hydrolase 1-like [Pangasianodon hypophthalmus]
MESERVRDRSSRNRRKRFLLIGVAVLVVVAVLAIVFGIIAAAKNSANSSDSFKNVVIKRCETYLKEKENMPGKNDCKIIWGAFEQAYIGRDPCDVPPEAYDPLISSVKQDVTCNTMLFWSKTKTMVHAFTDNRDCVITLEDTLLGFLFDGLTWCSKNDSKETFTTACPSWSDCQNNPVRSFWIKASLNFAGTACGNVSAMLNGSLEAPFSSTSVFGSVEVKNLNPDKVDGLTVLLVTKDTDTIIAMLEDPVDKDPDDEAERDSQLGVYKRLAHYNSDIVN